MPSRLSFDYSKGRVFLQDGTIYYSPNSKRPVIIPPRSTFVSDPFNHPRLNVSMFKQPVWWSDFWGWPGFIPLSPSFLSTPFEAFCSMPRIQTIEVFRNLPSGDQARETRYKMFDNDIQRWMECEDLIVGAANHLRLQYKIPGNSPPKPSSFHFDRAHKSFPIAKRMICLSREWFIIWMGFISYLIAQTERHMPNTVPDRSSPYPDWYNFLRNNHGFSEFWLDGFLYSNICSFDLKTPRAGIIFQWTETDRQRPPIEWLHDHHIPLWFPWTSAEERRIREGGMPACLEPPVELVQEALQLLFSSPNIPLASRVIQNYYRLGSDPITNDTLDFLRLEHAPSAVYEFTAVRFATLPHRLRHQMEGTSGDLKNLLASRRQRNEAAAEAAASFPVEGLLSTVDYQQQGRHTQAMTMPAVKSNRPTEAMTTPAVPFDRPTEAMTTPAVQFDRLLTTGEKVYNHFDDFFAARERRQADRIKVETSSEHQRRLSLERAKPIKSSTMYEWEKIRSSGGQEMYTRIRVNKKANEDVYARYKSWERVYNAVANEWDFCEDFSFGPRTAEELQEDDSGDDYDDYDYCPQPPHSQPLLSSPPSTSPSQAMDIIEDGKSSPKPPHSQPPLSSPPTIPSQAIEDGESSPGPSYSGYSRDVVESMSLIYGYVSPLGAQISSTSSSQWEVMLGFLGFVNRLSELSVPDVERRALEHFFFKIASKTAPVSDLDDLDSNNRLALSSLFEFSQIQRPSQDLFVFLSLRSTACEWVLGVHSPAAALYVCRYLLQNCHANSVINVAHRLLERGIPFRTLLPLTCNPQHSTISQPYAPTTYRSTAYKFVYADFRAAMLQAQSVLSFPQGRAALLQGGIVGRIAKEFLSVDGVLDGPSIEVTAHRVGYIGPSGNGGLQFCDDEITEREVAIICGTYKLYTGKIDFFVFNFFFSYGSQDMESRLLCTRGSPHPPPGKHTGLVTGGLIGPSAVKSSIRTF